MEEENKQQKEKKIPTRTIINICIILFIVFFLGYHFFQSIKCGDNMMILRIAIDIYAQDNKGKYPQNLNKLDEGKYFQEGFWTDPKITDNKANR